MEHTDEVRAQTTPDGLQVQIPRAVLGSGLREQTVVVVVALERGGAVHPSVARARVASGARTVREAAVSALAGGPQVRRMGDEVLERLTQRQASIVQLVAEGLSLEQIAARMRVTHGSVRAYLSAIYGKLGVTSHAALVDWLWSHGLVDRG